MAANILPDSRTRGRRGIVRSSDGRNWVPVYCINCGKEAGIVPEAHITHVTALCDNGCAGKYGDLAATYVDPDHVFRQNLAEALSPSGRVVTVEELERILDEPSPALAAAARDWNARTNKENR